MMLNWSENAEEWWVIRYGRQYLVVVDDDASVCTLSLVTVTVTRRGYCVDRLLLCVRPSRTTNDDDSAAAEQVPRWVGVCAVAGTLPMARPDAVPGCCCCCCCELASVPTQSHWPLLGHCWCWMVQTVNVRRQISHWARCLSDDYTMLIESLTFHHRRTLLTTDDAPHSERPHYALLPVCLSVLCAGDSDILLAITLKRKKK